MAENRTVTAIYLTVLLVAVLDRSRGSTPRSPFLAGLVEQDVDEPGVYDGPVLQVPRSKADKRVTFSLRAEVADKANRRRGDLPLATYSASVILTALDKLERQLAYEDHRRRCEREEAERLAREEAEQEASVEAAQAGRTSRARAHSPSSKTQHTKRKPRKKPKNSPQPTQRHHVDGRTRVERRPRPRGEIRLEEAPWTEWESTLPPLLQEVEDRLQAERKRKASKPERSDPPPPSRPSHPTPASSTTEILAPPPRPSPDPSQPSTTPERSMHTHLPPRPSHQQSPRPGVIKRKNVAGDLRALDRLLDRWRSEELRWPPLDLIASLDHEGVATTEAFAELSLRDLGHSARILIGLSPEDGEWIGLEEGELRATWQRALAVIQAHAERYLLRLEATPTVWSRALEQDDYDDDPDDDDEYDSEDLDEEAQDEPLVTSVLGIDISVVAVGRPSQPQWR